MKKPASRKTWIIMAVIAVIAIAGTVMVRNGTSSKEISREEASNQTREELKPTNVVVKLMAPESVEESFMLPGTLEAWENLTLSLEQAGPIRWIGPEEGDRLRKGEAVLRTDSDVLESQKARNRVDYEVKKKNLERAESLLSQELVSERDRDEARKDFESAKASLDQTNIALEKTTVKSPINGILDRLLVDRGEYGNVGTPAAIVVQIDRLKVIVDVPEKDVTAVKADQKVEVFPARIRRADGMSREGKVIHVAYQADEMTRTYRTKIEIDNSTRLLRPGMIVRVRFVRRILERVLVIPLYAVIDREGQKFVFVEEDGTAIERQVRLGPIINGRVVVHGGIQEGENLIVKGHQLVSDGGPVDVIGDPGKEG
ncbi:MAG: efflux RND transporter periplasmic adaptor subunit [bacterium]